MDFEQFLSPPALVQKKKKYQTFTVKEIGGPAEIIVWRQQQAAKESLQQMRLTNRDNRLGDFEALTGQKLDHGSVTKAPWAEKVSFAKEERARLRKVEDLVTVHPPWEVDQPPKKPIFQRIVGFFKQLWRDANN